MATLYFGANRATLNVDGNYYLAHFQVVVHESFREGRGFMVSLAGGRDNHGDPLPRTTHWFNPGMPLEWVYDEDEPPVDIEESMLETIRRGINHPMGVLIWPTGIDPMQAAAFLLPNSGPPPPSGPPNLRLA
jgi:hypothetical protein